MSEYGWCEVCGREITLVENEMLVAGIDFVEHHGHLVRRVKKGDERAIVTKTGKFLTEADIQDLADEAERGYDVSKLRERKED